MRTIALANQKGGVGKTTTAVHLAHGLALAGQEVALFDLDPQANATLALQGMSGGEEAETGARRVLLPLHDHLWVLPSPGVERELGRDIQPDVAKLEGLRDDLGKDGFQWLLVDCPPRMDAWGWAGLELCDEVILPVQAEFFAMHGLSKMMQTIEGARRKRPVELLGVLTTMVDVREAIAREVLADLRRNLGGDLFTTVVFRDASFVEAASHGLTLFDYNLESKGARAYGELAREILYGRAQ